VKHTSTILGDSSVNVNRKRGNLPQNDLSTKQLYLFKHSSNGEEKHSLMHEGLGSPLRPE
jgi:hypothetical protein